MFRLEVQGHCCVGAEQIYANIEHAATLGLPLLEQALPPRHGALAVVGGGPSVKAHLAELRSWLGEIWAINGTCQWLSSLGIESFLFSVDPEPCLAPLAAGVRRAVLASHVHPSVFAVLKDADVLVFHSEHAKGAKKPLIGGSTSATRIPMVALMAGYREVHYFGCEGSFAEATHSYKDEGGDQLIVAANGKDYRTSLQFMVQSDNLAQIIRKFPSFIERSGGLLAAMIAYPDAWEVVALSQSLRDQLDPTATELYPLERAA